MFTRLWSAFTRLTSALEGLATAIEDSASIVRTVNADTRERLAGPSVEALPPIEEPVVIEEPAATTRNGRRGKAGV